MFYTLLGRIVWELGKRRLKRKSPSLGARHRGRSRVKSLAGGLLAAAATAALLKRRGRGSDGR